MASRRKSTTPCMIRPNDLVEQDDMDVCLDSTLENGASHVPASENWTDKKNLVSTTRETIEPDKPEADARPQKKVQGGYECNTFDTLTEHNEKCHPGESNFKFKRIKLNSQTILEQTIEGSNCAVIYDATSPQTGEDLSTFPLSKPIAVKIGKPKTESKRPLIDSQMDKLTTELPKKQITAVNDGLSHIMPALQRPPNYNLVPKIAVPLNTSKYNASLDGNLTLITSFNKFPYPTQAELSWLTAASKHPEEQIKVWFTTQRLKQGISWSPGGVNPVSKNHTISYSGPYLAMLLSVPLTASVVAPEVKRPSISRRFRLLRNLLPLHQGLASDCKKTPDQIKELMASYTQCQFPDDEEVYRLIEMTGLSWGEIKKWFSDQRHGNHKAVQSLKADLPLKESQPQKPVATQFPLLERVKGKSSEQMKMLEECFQKTSFPTQAEIECLAADTRLSKTEIEGWFTERRALRDNLEQALLNSLWQEARARTSPLPLLTSSVGPEIDSKSLGLLKEVFSQTQWPSPEEYNQLELETGLARTELVRWFKDNRSALKNGTLEWMEQFQNMSNKKHNGKNSSLTTEPAQSVLQRHFQEANVLKGEDVEKLAERSKLTNQDIVNWFTSKLGHTMPDISKGKDQHEQGSADNGRWVKVSMAADNERKDSETQRVGSDLEILSAEHIGTG
uniref:Homeobox domain-containing protein n=1 Tax=Electrophorus electricus TaxID=8005 RepID=A0AAY5EEQ9_ELEEL